ncbi:hypothetical protein QE152_g31220 [Popillia japonica]|uniref:Transposable element P transposase n=1 Tax=Popillia japonica TaxID=7064 RepID=A0AAW1JCI0_POPJA
MLHSSVARAYVECNNKRIFTMFDPPHLLKCTAALFRKYNVDLPIDIGPGSTIMQTRFSDIRTAYYIDQLAPAVFRCMHKLKHAHMDLKMKSAMKVRIAAQLMSRTVAAYVFSLISRGALPQQSIGTATFVQQVDELFDSFNGDSKTAPDGKELHCIVTKESSHVTYWPQAFARVKNWNFQRYSTTGRLKQGKPPSQIGWLTSIGAMQGIWAAVNMNNLRCLRPRSLNQYNLENLFGAIRTGCGCNENPTASQFIASLKI